MNNEQRSAQAGDAAAIREAEVRRAEAAVKLARLRAFMAEHGYGAVRLQTPNLFAWLTAGGRNHIDITSDWTGAALFVTQDHVICVMASNEAARILVEELERVLDCDIRTYPWWGWADDAVRKLYEAGTVAGDMAFPGVVPIAEQLRSLFYPLLPSEIERYRALARDVSASFAELIPGIRQGMTEFELDGLLSGSFRRRGINPNVLMVATDERAERFMHPLATDKKLDRYGVVSVCAARGGLVVSQTRSFHLGKPDAALAARHEAAAAIAARLCAATIPGAKLPGLFQAALDTYAELGWADEWKRHTIGGKTGYRTREFSVGPNTEGEVAAGTAWGWNPTVAGTKSEDTIVAHEDGAEVLGGEDGWPRLTFEIGGRAWTRPGILIV